MIDMRFLIGFLILNLILACLYVSISHKLTLVSEILFHIITDCSKNEFSIVFFFTFQQSYNGFEHARCVWEQGVTTENLDLNFFWFFC